MRGGGGGRGRGRREWKGRESGRGGGVSEGGRKEIRKEGE